MGVELGGREWGEGGSETTTRVVRVFASKCVGTLSKRQDDTR